jgi:hypothetical protein
MKPGEKVVKQNKEYKHQSGEQPNNVANRFLADCRGEVVIVYFGEAAMHAGKLEEFDLYSFVVDGSLFFKGPGVWIQRS